MARIKVVVTGPSPFVYVDIDDKLLVEAVKQVFSNLNHLGASQKHRASPSAEMLAEHFCTSGGFKTFLADHASLIRVINPPQDAVR